MVAATERELAGADEAATLACGIGPVEAAAATAQALATRTAESIFTRYFDGDPWVARESPVSSVDDTVTAAVAAAGS